MASPYITPEGHARLKAEYDELWGRRRPAVVRALAAAAAEGDRSENAEYIYRKKELREIDRRVRYLQRRLPGLKVISQAPDDPDRVRFGARLRVSIDGAAARTLRIVGVDEAEASTGHVSVDAPLARALLGRAINEVVDVHTPGGAQAVEVLAIAYGDGDD